MTFLTREELEAIGFAEVGSNVLISEKASFYNAGYISIGDDVRIDDLCILSAGENGFFVGNNIHIGAYSSLIGQGRIQLLDFVNISSRVSIFSSNDDYSGRHLTNPMVPDEYKDVTVAPVCLEKHVIVGCGSVILPGVTLHEGAAVAALSLVKDDCAEFTIVGGRPATMLKKRSRALLGLEKELSART